jgi:hypothetical protein
MGTARPPPCERAAVFEAGRGAAPRVLCSVQGISDGGAPVQPANNRRYVWLKAAIRGIERQRGAQRSAPAAGAAASWGLETVHRTDIALTAGGQSAPGAAERTTPSARATARARLVQATGAGWVSAPGTEGEDIDMANGVLVGSGHRAPAWGFGSGGRAGGVGFGSGGRAGGIGLGSGGRAGGHTLGSGARKGLGGTIGSGHLHGVGGLESW